MNLNCFIKNQNVFFHYRNNLVYLYTENYKQKKDTVWLNTILLETLDFFKFSGTVLVNWSKDSIVSCEGSFLLVCEYDPIITEYRVYNKEIIEESYNLKKMLYPKTGKPKGIPLIEDMIKGKTIKEEPQPNYWFKRNYGGCYYGY